MLSKPVRVIKRDQIDIGGTVQLSPFTAAGRATASAAALASGAVPQQARIVQSNQNFAILEVVCGCGCKSHIQCHYENT